MQGLERMGRDGERSRNPESLEQGLGALAETLGNGGRQVWEDTGRNP